MANKNLRAIKSIVVATDLKADGLAAFNHALALSLILKAELSIVHVAEDADAGVDWHEFPAVRDTLTRWRLLEPGADKGRIASRYGITVRKIHTVGDDPAHTVAEFLNRHPANLLVLGSEARGPVARLLRPSVATGMARATRLLTLYLPRAVRGFVDADNGALTLERIVVPVTNSPDPRKALALAAELAFVLGDGAVPIDVVHAGAARPGGLELADDDRFHRWRFSLLAGEPAAAIAEAAAGAGLIVMTSAGRDGVVDALLGSTAERLLGMAHCPLLTIPAGGP